MIGTLLDTNVVSELIKPRPNARVVDWLQRTEEAFVSVLTVGELRRGAAALHGRDAARADRLETWIDQLLVEYRDRILTVEVNVVTTWSRLPHTRTLPVIDSLLAATALSHNLSIATRNIKDFDGLGVTVVNPFDGI